MYYCIQILECFSAIWNLYSKTAVQIVYMYSFESKIKKVKTHLQETKKYINKCSHLHYQVYIRRCYLSIFILEKDLESYKNLKKNEKTNIFSQQVFAFFG